MDVLLATSRDAPAELVTPVAAAIAAENLEVGTVDLGRVGETGSRLGRAVRALLGEVEAGRLVRELASTRPRVAVAFDAGAAAALVVARDRKVSSTAVVAIVPDLAPDRAWAVDADRYAVVDDEAAVALTELGIDGARVIVTGPFVPRALHEAARIARADARGEFKLPADANVVLVDSRGLELEELSQLTLQLSLVARPIYILFDTATSADAAAQIRRQVPTLGIKGKLFGDTPNAAKLWRCADVVVARPTARAVHATVAIDAALVALRTKGARQEAAVRALIDRRAGAIATEILLIGNALDPLLNRLNHRGGGKVSADGASEAAELVAQVAAHHEEVLAETAAAAAERVAKGAAADDVGGESAAGDVEDLDDLGELFGGAAAPAAPPPPRERPETVARRQRLERELADSRAEAEKWEQRRAAAERHGDKALAEQAAREADRKRARMHTALADLARLAQSAPPEAAPEDPLAALKRKVGGSSGAGAGARTAAAAPRTVDDELAALKSQFEAEKKGRRP